MTDVAAPWLDSYPPGVPQHVELPQVNLARLLADAARDFPHAPALHFEGRTVSYAELADQAWRFAGALARLGVTKGTRVGLVLPNCPQAVVPSLLDELPAVRRRLAPYTRRGREASAGIPRDEPVRRWRELLRRSDAKPPEAEVDATADVALLQYTGGTTGVSKGVVLSHSNLLANVEQVRAWFPDADPGHEIVLAVLPFFHVYGLTVCLLLGVRLRAALVLLPRFDLGQVLAAVDRYRPTLLPGVPTIYVAINNAVAKGGHDLSSIKACLSGGAPLPLEVAERFERFSGGRLVEGYGL